ncbi:MAG TPA: YdeI/OmpD-associated family protein [Candidatus Saccharimonadales bacterium]|nr:YdeI/OmpD-associated family protein [Candidatus Saccharimonadales bacterium]
MADTFKARLVKIGQTTLLVLPKEASAPLPSRGMVAITGTLNDHPFWAVLEPDGRGSHWLKVDKPLRDAAGIVVGKLADVTLRPTKKWQEPDIPADIIAGLKADSEGYKIWQDITPMARWDWIRWIRATNNPDTRAKHVDVMLSKLKHGIRRPCCFNRSMCTDFSVAKNGVLLAPQD